jgi:VanZ family protein
MQAGFRKKSCQNKNISDEPDSAKRDQTPAGFINYTGIACSRERDMIDKTCYPGSMTTILRILAWLLAAAVTFATLSPPRLRPHSNLGQDGEHALAFVLIGLAFGLAYPRHRLITSAISVVMIGVIEILQLWVPGRHARLEDFAVDALAACAGLAVIAGLDRTMQRLRWNTKTS